MTAPYYVPSGTPATGATGSSSDMRSEFDLIETAIDKLPALTANNVVIVNASGTAMTVEGSLAVSRGGTGAATLTDGGVLLGSGTGAFTAMAVLADGEMIVGDGTTDPVAESGATLRTSIGVGTGDTVTFNIFTATNMLAAGEITVTNMLTAGEITMTAANPEVLGSDTDGIMYIAPSTTNALGGNILLYGDTHATQANDIEFRATAGVEAHYDDSASKWDFQANAIETTGAITTTGTVGTGSLAVTGTFTVNGLSLFDKISDHFYRNN